MDEKTIRKHTNASPAIDHPLSPQLRTPAQLDSDSVELLSDEAGAEQTLTSHWDEELIRRSQALHIKSRGSETDRQEVALVHKAGVILKALRQGQRIPSAAVAAHLGVEPGFIAFLENGLVSLDEVYPKLRDQLAEALDLDPRIVDLIFEPT